jgi:hypothetical protein
MSGNDLNAIAPKAGLYGADGMRTNMLPTGPLGSVSAIDPNKISTVFGESDPMGQMPQKPQMDPKLLQLMLSMRGMGGMGGQQPQAQPGMPAPQVQPGALMGAMPQMPQGGFRPRGMAGRF